MDFKDFKKHSKKIIGAVLAVMAVILYLLRCILFGICPVEPTYMTIANWNLQIFGDAKAHLVPVYASIIDDYNITFVQEIRDADLSAFIQLCAALPD